MMCGAGLQEWDLSLSGAEHQHLGLDVELQGWGLEVEGQAEVEGVRVLEVRACGVGV